ncbi:hypothetical protein BKA83DRAFT_4340917 [Pisolithus microcarpus]|nr:hypothetical protein BKA83DRAFT_4340917 [Pisolithus microcarpus]
MLQLQRATQKHVARRLRKATLQLGAWQAQRGLATPSGPYDALIIGGGPGGYVAAIKAAQLGLKTACVEKRGALGGTSMLNNSHLRGIDVSGVSLNLSQMLKAKISIEMLFKQNKVDYIKGAASFVSPNRVAVKLLDGGETEVEATNIIIATGFAPFPGGAIEIDEKRIVSSTGKMVVIGGGIIGLEMGSVWSRLGAEVTVVEFLGGIGGLGSTKKLRDKQFQKLLAKQGLKFKLNTKVSVKTQSAKGDNEETLEADVVLVSGLNLEAAGVQLDNKGRIVIDDQFATSAKHIRCIGDVTFGPMLAHKAEEEGIAAIEHIKHGHGHVNYNAIPSVFLSEKETDRILGVHIIGPNAGEMISEAVLAIEYGASSEDIARTTHAHPTLSEAFKEAAMATYSKPIHF